MRAILLLALPLAAQAQLVLYAVNGSTQTPVGSTYQFPPVAPNTTYTEQFQVFNAGTTPVMISVTTLSGYGFTFESSPVLPYTIPPNSTADVPMISVSFTPASTASFSANLQIGPLSVILLGCTFGVPGCPIVASPPTLTSVSGCTGSGPFNWGDVPTASSVACTFMLANLNPQAISVASIAVNGLGFSGPVGVAAPLTLQAGQSASFSVTFSPTQPILYSATLTVGTQTYALTGIGLPQPLPTPSLQFDSGPFASGQQRILTMTIPGGAPVAATGYVNLTFTPSTAVVKDDSEIVFLANGARTVPFSVAPGATTVLLNGQNSATFQTGTTEGTITFTVTTAAALVGDPTTHVTIGGSSAIIDSATASKEVLGSLVITLTGADNTYSLGKMSFSFFDTSGNAMGSPSADDFTSSFKTYYGGAAAGSAFVAQVTFPVIGSVATIGSVTVTLTNAAGVANTGSLTFQ